MISLLIRFLFAGFTVCFLFFGLASCRNTGSDNRNEKVLNKPSIAADTDVTDSYIAVFSLLVLPRNPVPGENIRILSTGGSNIQDAKIIVSGPNGVLEPKTIRKGKEIPYWRIDSFSGTVEGSYNVSLISDGKEVSKLEFKISPLIPTDQKNGVWKITRGWDYQMETIYSAWINALFQDTNEQSSWPALHKVTQDQKHNFLFNFLSLGEDDPGHKNTVSMQPDCADNPFFLRAYFSWKMGLPFGFHICDRGYLGKSPGPSAWVNNKSFSSSGNEVRAFNNFLKNIMNGVHSGTARTSLDNEKSDYYPVALERESLRPGTVYADPYGHTLIIVCWKPQTKDHPGVLLAVDAQPDKTIAIKRFWKGNFLFNTSEVIGEPGFKAFRPITYENGKLALLSNDSLTLESHFVPFSLQQRKMESEDFYHTMDRLINPKPLDPEAALTDLVQALYEQLLVRVKSISTGEEYMKSHPGTIIPMPSSANGIFLAGGDWENYSTPNRDLRLLIAIDAVMNFPDRINQSPEDFQVPPSISPEEMKNKLQALLTKKISELTINYNRSDGSTQTLTLAEIINRRAALEMAYNPNDGPEIRWGAPNDSEEIKTCRRHAPLNQQKVMDATRKWFNKRLHPPT